MSKVLVFSRDPGPTNYLIALLEALAHSGDANEAAGILALRSAIGGSNFDVHIAARGPALALWRASGESPVPWCGRTESDAADLIKKTSANFVVTGSSDIDEPADHALWLAARKFSVESHVIIEHPANLDSRFRNGQGERLWPSWIYVPNKTFVERVEAIGGSSDRIRIVGELHHTRIKHLAANLRDSDIEALRNSWGANIGTRVFLFASECVLEMRSAGCASSYDEFSVLDKLLIDLGRGVSPDGRNIDLEDLLVIIRPHPRDTIGKYDAYMTHFGARPRILVSEEGSPELAILSADLIVGMNSSFLYEALELNRPVLSLTGHQLSSGKGRAG